MTTAQLPIIPRTRPYYTAAEAMVTDNDGTVFKAIIASKDRHASAHVYMLSGDRKSWKEVTGDWSAFDKPNTIGLAQSGADLLVSISTRENGDSDDYPSRTFVAAGVCGK